MKNLLNFSLGLILFGILGLSGLNAQEAISLTGHPRPGGLLFCRITPEKEPVSVSLNLANYTSSMFKEKTGSWLALIPVSPDIRPGKYLLTVALMDDRGEKTKITREVPIQAFSLGEQYISLAPESEDPATQKKLEEEYKAVDKALATFTPDQIWWGNFLRPTPGPTTTTYGLKRTVTNQGYSYRHRGIDIAAGQGIPVEAANTGVVALARTDFIHNGEMVALDHGQGLMTVYLHMSVILVKPGDLVKKGQVIGKVGTTGFSTGPHLHWGAYLRGKPFDPTLLMTIPQAAE